METKLYCYVDETGQDTLGKIFLVVVIIDELENMMKIEKKLEFLEQVTGKGLLKWKHTDKYIKVRYLEEVSKIKELKGTIFFAIYRDSTSYVHLTASTVAQVLL